MSLNKPREVNTQPPQLCELSENLGLDLDKQAITHLREARRDWESGNRSAFVALEELQISKSQIAVGENAFASRNDSCRGIDA